MTHFSFFLKKMPWMMATIVFASLALSPASGELNSDPVLGMWRLSEGECQFSPALPPVSITRSYQPASGGLTRISETRYTRDGQQILIEYAVGYDGKEYPIFITAPGANSLVKSEDTVSFRRVDRYTAVGVFRLHGNKTSEFTREVSKDGQRLSVRVSGIDSTGVQRTTLLVYDRLIT